MQVHDSAPLHRHITLTAGEALDTRLLISALVGMGEHTEDEATNIVSDLFDAVECQLRAQHPQLAA